jgi:HSP20 family protein
MVPFEDVDRWFSEIGRRFDDLFSQRWLSPFERLFPSFLEVRAPFEGRTPKVDVIDREAEIVIRGELPGVAKEDLEVSMTDDAVTIRASTRHEERAPRKGSRLACYKPTFQELATTYLKIKLVSDMLYNWEHVTSER